MRLYNLISATFLLGIGACSSQESAREAPPAQKVSAIVAAPVSSGAPGARTVRHRFAPIAASVTSAAPIAAPVSSAAPIAVPTTGSGAVRAANHADAAAASLPTLKELVASGPPERRAFHSGAEVDSATLSTPLPVFMVGLDALIAYRPGQATWPLLRDKREVMYPVTVGGEVRTSVVVKQRADGHWEPGEFGHANVAKTAHAGRHDVSAMRGIAEANLSLVEIPALAAYLLSHDEHGVLMLTPIYDVTGTDLKAGQTHSAAEVFSVLQPLAMEVGAATTGI